MSKEGYDVRGICNFMLDIAEQKGRKITNLHLNKVIYFSHADFLVHCGRPLISSKIEAWQYGPVIREVYGYFKKFGRKEISGRISQYNFKEGKEEIVRAQNISRDANFVESLFDYYSCIPTSVLVDISHARGGAWDLVWNHESELNVGMEITNDLIVENETFVRGRKRNDG